MDLLITVDTGHDNGVDASDSSINQSVSILLNEMLCSVTESVFLKQRYIVKHVLIINLL